MDDLDGPPRGMQIQTMQEAAALMHEFYTSLTTAGFTQQEALALVTGMLNTLVIQGFLQQ